MEDEEKVITVENKDGKGNPNHAPAGSPGSTGGQFVSGPQSGGQEEVDDMGTVELKEAPKSALGNALMDFIKQKKEVANKEAQDFIGSINEHVGEEQKKFYGELSREQKLSLLYDSPLGYDKKKLGLATDSQLDALLYAEAVGNKYPQFLQSIELKKQEKEKIENEIESTLSQNNIDAFSGIWAYSTKHPSDWKDLKDSGSIDKKREYYKSVLENPNSPLQEKLKAKQYSAKLDEFEQLGQEYENLKESLYAQHLDKLEKIETEISDIQAKSLQYKPDSELIELTQNYINKFVDKNSAYSAERKNKAVWFKNGGAESVQLAATQFFGPKWEKLWSNLTYTERDVLIDYTGGGFSKYNKPLRGLSHGGWSYWDFANNVTNLTNAIDKCTWEEDIWVQRGISDSNIFKLPGSAKAKSLYGMSDAELQSLVGTSFIDKGFYSAGAGKGTGFSSNQVILNTYCPKGTKMAFMNTKGHYAHTSENEMILQRGYEYRITKVQRQNGKYYIDVEVVLGSDEKNNIYDLEELKKIGSKHLT